jgi:hypothetical protein
MGDYLTEEIYGTLTKFIWYMLKEPNAISDIRNKTPSGLSGACETR